MWQELIDNIKELLQIYNKLFKLNERKRQAITAIDMLVLDGLVDKERELSDSIMRIEQKRQAILKKMAAGNAAINESSSFKNLLVFCPDNYKKEFVSDNEALSAVVQKTIVISENNRLLMQGALTAVNMNINSLSGVKAAPGYEKNGEQNFSANKRKLDFEV
ncbi:flagellar protein FlgN [Pectinatus frisingensis]|uniref:flagellar protein FlgN n=1 Tax=Pectinatus frisingensis TaxID=865 RepID=UPI0018C7FB6D|nr:flagellar protein FlgN [Pectinatus frisingensis]